MAITANEKSTKCSLNIVKFRYNPVKQFAPEADSFVTTNLIATLMDYPITQPENNEDKDGYKVPGDGNVPNASAKPSNHSFDENPHAMIHKIESDIPGNEFNTGDKAFHDSSKKNFIETVSKMHHANPETRSNLNIQVDMSYKKPDGDR